MADEEHTHITVNGDEEHRYEHAHEDGHEPHGHQGDEEIVEIWEDDDAPEA